MPSEDIQNFCKSLNSNGDASQPPASDRSSVMGIWRVSLSTLTVMFISRSLVVSSTTVVAFFQSDRWSLVIQYSNGVMKKFHGKRVAILIRKLSTKLTVVTRLTQAGKTKSIIVSLFSYFTITQV